VYTKNVFQRVDTTPRTQKFCPVRNSGLDPLCWVGGRRAPGRTALARAPARGRPQWHKNKNQCSAWKIYPRANWSATRHASSL